MDPITLRTVLLISLSITVVVLAARRFRQWVLLRDMPAVLHAEVLALEVLYHPPRIRLEVKVPRSQRISTGLRDPLHSPLHQWPDATLAQGTHSMEWPLPALADGEYVVEVSTTTQRTFRTFRLRST